MNINWWEYHILNRHDNLIYIKYTVISTFDFTVKNCIKHFKIYLCVLKFQILWFTLLHCPPCDS